MPLAVDHRRVSMQDFLRAGAEQVALGQQEAAIPTLGVQRNKTIYNTGSDLILNHQR